MAIGAINPFKNLYNKEYGSQISSGYTFGQYTSGRQSTQSVNPSIFGQDLNVGSVSKANPFSAVSSVTKGIAPVNAQANYRNGLAPADDLQDVFAGYYNGKPNFLNQIAIA